VIFSIAGLLLTNVAPFLGVAFGHGWVRVLAAVGLVMALALQCGVDVVLRASPLYCLTLPLGAILFGYMLLRSMVVTLRQGGIIWRGTFYPLAELRRGAV
jgi:2-keto-4-pentenoate hydratase